MGPHLTKIFELYLFSFYEPTTKALLVKAITILKARYFQMAGFRENKITILDLFPY